MKHGFLITAHAYFGQLTEIIELLSAPNHYFFINIDKKAMWGGQFIDNCKRKYSNVFFLEGKERMAVAHGGYTQIECTLRLLHKAYDMGCDYFHLISGQDYPCRPNEEFDRFFEENEGKSFMEIESENYHEKCMVKKYPSRVQPWFIKDFPHREIKVVDYFVRAFNKISSHFYVRKMIPGLWGGWNWFTWHRSLAGYVIEQEKSNPKFFKRFHHTGCGDELIFQTLFHGKEEELNIDGSNALRYINWSKKVPGRTHLGSPLLLNEEEYDDIIKSGAFFCRKVHPVVSKVLLEKLRENILR